MDNLTDSLVAVAVSRAGFQRLVPQATLLLVIAANLPDIDFLALAGGQLSAFEIHRGYTHSLVMLPLMAAVSVLIVSALTRTKLPVLRSWLVACLGVGIHLLLDWSGSFGLRLFLPFSSQWSYLDLNGFYDGVVMAALALAFIWPWFTGLVSGEIGGKTKQRGQGSAIAVLLFLLIYEGGRWSLQQRALNELGSRLYDGQVPLQVSALAEPNNPFAWTGVVETQDAFRVVSMGPLDVGGFSDSRIFRKPARSSAYLSALRSEAFRYMVYFARFPVWEIEPLAIDSGLGERVDLTDLRFGAPGVGILHAGALIAGSGRLLEWRFGFTTRAMDEMFERHKVQRQEP